MAKKNKIVIVEDDEVLAQVLNNELEDAGFEVTQAFDGQSGLALVKSKRPNLVLLDLVLPKKHGFDVLGELKKSPDTKGIPVIILTLLGEDDDIKKGLKLGADDYIVKADHPVAEIIEKVKSFLPWRAIRKQNKRGYAKCEVGVFFYNFIAGIFSFSFCFSRGSCNRYFYPRHSYLS